MVIRLYLILCLGMYWFTTLGQDNKNPVVTGVIYSQADHRPLRDVSVINIMSGAAMKSDMYGKFGIPGNQGDTLQFSLLGYEQLRLGVKDINVSPTVYMTAKNNYLEEVQINTGYQVVKPNETTGAVDVISNDMLNQQTGTRILDRLNNVASGLRFENKPSTVPDRQKLNFSVRGLSTIDGNLDPLIVLDGFIYEGDVANIDPNSVESITILKDAAASAIWGARAGNGVVVISSRNGVRNNVGKMNLSFGSTLISKTKPDLRQLYQLSNNDYIAIESMLFKNGFYDKITERSPFISVTPAVDIFDRTERGLLTPEDSARMIGELLLNDGRRAYHDLFLENPFSQQYALNLSGGTQQYAYGFYSGYTKDIDQYAGGFRKLNLRLTNSFYPTDKLNIDFNLLFTNGHNVSGKPTYESLTYNGKLVPYINFYNSDGSERAFFPDFRATYMADNYGEPYMDWGYYPLSDYKHAVATTRLNEWFGTINGKYKFFPFLDLNIGFQYQSQRTETQDIFNEQSYYARKTVNQYTEISNGGNTVTYHIPKGGVKNADISSGRSYTARTQLNLNKSWRIHRLIGMLGGEIRETVANGENYRVYGYKEKPLQTIPVDYTAYFTVVPSMIPLGIPGNPTFTERINRFISLYANWSYILKDKYAWSGSFRKDGANIFGARTNEKWTPLWSTGISWDIGKEDFLQLKWVDRLKVRATYGYSGNVDLRKTPEPIASVTSGTYTRFPALTISTLNDPSLRWEKVSTFNLGMDFSILKNRIAGSVDFYIKTGKDLYGLTEFDYTTWGKSNTVTKNVASMRGKGWDFNVTTKNIDKRIKWNSHLLFNLNKNKTIAYYRKLNTGVFSFLGDGNAITPIIGMPLNAIAAFKWMGLDEQGNPQGMLDGEASKDYTGINNSSLNDGTAGCSILFYGSAKPQLFGSLANSIQWNAWSLSFNVSFKADYYFRKPATSYYNLFNKGLAYPDFELRWQKSGDEAHKVMPALQYPLESFRDAFYQQSEINVLKADHVRLEYVNLAWTKDFDVPKGKMRLKLYGNASNLGLLWTSNKKRIDPEFPYQIAPPKTLSLGCQLNY